MLTVEAIQRRTLQIARQLFSGNIPNSLREAKFKTKGDINENRVMPNIF